MNKELPKLLYDKQEAAELLGLKSVEWILRKGQLSHRKVAGKIRFKMDDLQAYIESSKVARDCAAR